MTHLYFHIHYALAGTDGKAKNETFTSAAFLSNCKDFRPGQIKSKSDIEEIFEDYSSRYHLLSFSAVNSKTGEVLSLLKKPKTSDDDDDDDLSEGWDSLFAARFGAENLILESKLFRPKDALPPIDLLGLFSAKLQNPSSSFFLSEKLKKYGVDFSHFQ